MPSAKHVLLIEDREDVYAFVKEALSGAGYFLEWADRISYGLERLAIRRPNVVVLHSDLPKCSGLVTYAKVRQLAPHVPVVVISNSACPQTEGELRAAGAAAYMVKGKVSSAELLNAIDENLGCPAA